jgi:serine/threonine-protein phosphatase 2A activator
MMTMTQPLLHNLSTSFPNFNKIHSGLFKMYLEEVLNKRVVVQHLPIPDWVWEREARR